jgi:Domain of unknown function (DUF1707)
MTSDGSFPLMSWDEIQEALKILHERDPKHWGKDIAVGNEEMVWDGQQYVSAKRVVPSNAVAIPEGVNILPNGTRAGDADRDRAINHLTQMADLGYLPPEEAEKRIKHAENAERKVDLKTLTADLPAPLLGKRTLRQRYDWDKPAHWIPTLIGGMAVGGLVAVLPAEMLSTAHMFPNTTIGAAFGILGIITGILLFFGCLAGIIVKASEA